MRLDPSALHHLPAAVERVRVGWTRPAVAAARRSIAQALLPVRRWSVRRARLWAVAPLWVQTRRRARALAQSAAPKLAVLVETTAAARLWLVDAASLRAAASRAACRRTTRAFVAPVVALAAGLKTSAAVGPDASPLAAISALLAPAREAARRATWTDGVVAALAVAALSGPFLSGHLGRDATIALTRHNPFAERVMVTAERDLSVLTPTTATLWTGAPAARAERSMAPAWVMAAGDVGALDPAVALATGARVLEVEPAPLWSPFLAVQGVADDGSEYASLETATIITSNPRGGVDLEFAPIAHSGGAGSTPRPAIGDDAALALGNFSTGPVAPVRTVGVGAPGVQPGAVARGQYATASVAVGAADAWPGRSGGALPPGVAAALNLSQVPAAVAPPKRAPLPPRRPIVDGPQKTARITIVLTAVGLNPAASRAALESLPSSVALAVAPVAPSPERWVAAAQSDGRVALLEIPMEPASYPRVNPGPLTLLADDSPQANARRLADALAKAPGVDGVATYLGDRFTQSADAVTSLVADLKKRDLFVLETAPSALSQLGRAAASAGVTAKTSLVSIDKSGRAFDLSEGLATLEAQARADGAAIGVGVAIPSTVEALALWARDLESRGFQLTALGG